MADGADDPKFTQFQVGGLSTMAVGAISTLQTVFREWVKDRGFGPWFDALEEQVVRDLKNTTSSGVSMEAEIQYLDASIVAVRACFDLVRKEKDGGT